MWAWSPRQAAGFLELAAKRHGRELAEQVNVTRLAMHGDADQVEKQLRQWTR